MSQACRVNANSAFPIQTEDLFTICYGDTMLEVQDLNPFSRFSFLYRETMPPTATKLPTNRNRATIAPPSLLYRTTVAIPPRLYHPLCLALCVRVYLSFSILPSLSTYTHTHHLLHPPTIIYNRLFSSYFVAL